MGARYLQFPQSTLVRYDSMAARWAVAVSKFMPVPIVYSTAARLLNCLNAHDVVESCGFICAKG
jgi:hypothetical protein